MGKPDLINHVAAGHLALLKLASGRRGAVASIYEPTDKTGRHKTPRRRPAPPIAHRAAPVEKPPPLQLAMRRSDTCILVVKAPWQVPVSRQARPGATRRSKAPSSATGRNWENTMCQNTLRPDDIWRPRGWSLVNKAPQQSSCESPGKTGRHVENHRAQMGKPDWLKHAT
jgi:hypothetical protein